MKKFFTHPFVIGCIITLAVYFFVVFKYVPLSSTPSTIKAKVYYNEHWFDIHHDDWKYNMKEDSLTYSNLLII